jgi:hypothetical protein
MYSLSVEECRKREQDAPQACTGCAGVLRKRGAQHKRFNDSRRRGVLGRFRLSIKSICSGAGPAALPSTASMLLAAMGTELRPV